MDENARKTVLRNCAKTVYYIKFDPLSSAIMLRSLGSFWCFLFWIICN